MAWRLRVEHRNFSRSNPIWESKTWVTGERPIITRSDKLITIAWNQGEVHMLPVDGLGHLELFETADEIVAAK
jgi:hypothetical protein